ncbi:TetR family transcriptional regulator [Marivibrio halodurans]|nr:TetR/AcrR family transcriptional regulator [Marivibrio halodurans]
MRRRPAQKRSRERVERLLEAAATLIAESGSDGLRMSEVAARAGVPIGSLYQYFPDKSAIIHALSERYFAEGRRCVEDGLDGVETPAALSTAFADLVDEYYALFKAEPVLCDIRTGTQADRSLQALDLEDSRANGAILAAALRRVGSGAPDAVLTAETVLIMHFGESAMRLAVVTGGAEGDALVAAYKRMALDRIARLVE